MKEKFRCACLNNDLIGDLPQSNAKALLKPPFTGRKTVYFDKSAIQFMAKIHSLLCMAIKTML